MNRLSRAKRAQILHMLVEGSSMRSVSRVVGCSIMTVMKLMVEAGEACERFHNEHVRNLQTKRVECDEIWAFCHAKQKNAAKAKRSSGYVGDLWTWTAIDSDSKLIISWVVSTTRDGHSAIALMHDLRSRLSGRVQMTTDGWKAYMDAVEGSFGRDVDYAQLIKVYNEKMEVTGVNRTVLAGRPDPSLISTSYMERRNLTTRMSVRRYTRLTNAFSKKVRNHELMLALYLVYYNFCKVHGRLKKTPAMTAGLREFPMTLDELLGLVDEGVPLPPGALSTA